MLSTAAANIRIVLVEPAGPLNVGSVARVMKNMGLHQLILVNPQCDYLGEEARLMAVRAADILENARVVESLPAALVGCTRAIATTGDDRPLATKPEAPADALPWLLEAPSALIFGREDCGLTNAELNYAQRLIRIPSSEAYTSLNLAQAVAICCYELYKLVLNPPLAVNPLLEFNSLLEVNPPLPPPRGENKEPPPRGENKEPPPRGENKEPSPRGEKKEPSLGGENKETPPYLPQGGNEESPPPTAPKGGMKNHLPQGGNEESPPPTPPKGGMKNHLPQGGKEESPPSTPGRKNHLPQGGNEEEPPPSPKGGMKKNIPQAVKEEDGSATLENLEGYYQQLETLLLKVGYLHPHTAASRMAKFRHLYNRAYPSVGEVAMLRGILRQVEWAIGKTHPIGPVSDTLDQALPDYPAQKASDRD